MNVSSVCNFTKSNQWHPKGSGVYCKTYCQTLQCWTQLNEHAWVRCGCTWLIPDLGPRHDRDLLFYYLSSDDISMSPYFPNFSSLKSILVRRSSYFIGLEELSVSSKRNHSTVVNMRMSNIWTQWGTRQDLMTENISRWSQTKSNQVKYNAQKKTFLWWYVYNKTCIALDWEIYISGVDLGFIQDSMFILAHLQRERHQT